MKPQFNRKEDYAERIKVPTEKGALQGVMRHAKSVIALLTQNATQGTLGEYTGQGSPITLPFTYKIRNTQVRFLPGWGKYYIGKGDKERAFDLPETKEDLLRDFETYRTPAE